MLVSLQLPNVLLIDGMEGLNSTVLSARLSARTVSDVSEAWSVPGDGFRICAGDDIFLAFIALILIRTFQKKPTVPINLNISLHDRPGHGDGWFQLPV